MVSAASPTPVDANAEAFELAGGRIASMARAHDRRVAMARDVARSALILAAFVWGAILARKGTPVTRAGGFAIFASMVVVTLGWIIAARRRNRDARAVLSRLFGPRHAGVRAVVRALPLLVQRDGTSHELARLAVEQRIGALDEDRATARARNWWRGFWLVAFAAFFVTMGSCTDGFRVVEGTDVMLAREGTAPVPLPWLRDAVVRIRPPEYLHLPERVQGANDPMTVFVGSALAFEGEPIHQGRALYLTDGKARVPFVDDGNGHVSARWTAMANARVRVVAAFGEVDIADPNVLTVDVTPDAPPEIALEGAPKTLHWNELDPGGEIPLRWEITDDHGLREVDLVLLTGEEEDRRALVQLDSDVRRDRGGHMLRASDPFLKRARAPVTIRIEAKDNDQVTGPKWGKSAAILLIMPAVGEQEALRAAALAKLRSTWLDVLTKYDAEGPPKGSKKSIVDAVIAANEETTRVLAASYGTLRIPARLARLVAGKSKKALTTAKAFDGGGSFSAAETAAEKATLVIDAVLRGQNRRDARTVSLALGEIADDARRGVHEIATGSPSAPQRVAANIETLAKSAPHFRTLGGLGADIGEIVVAYLARYNRAADAKDWVHAELVLDDLSLRLKTPDPSFGAKGEARGEAGASGGGEGADEAPEPDEVSSAFREALGDLDRLTSDHKSQLEQLEQALEQAQDKDDVKAIEEELKKHAKNVRDAVQELPSQGPGSESFAGKAAQAKEQAEAMADALERKSLKEALMRGKQAQATLDDAKKAVRNRRAFSEPSVEAEADDARRALDRETEWAEKALEQLKKKAEARAKPKLGEQSGEEKRLAERAQETHDRLKREDAMPDQADQAMQQAEQAMKKAEKALKEGDSEGAGKMEREAQDKLEQARQAMNGDEKEGDNKDGNGNKEDGESKPTNGRANVPGKKDEKMSDFRDRVQRGMAKPGAPKFRDAAKRYAEGLLR